jgi:hypothetical protein
MACSSGQEPGPDKTKRLALSIMLTSLGSGFHSR